MNIYINEKAYIKLIQVYLYLFIYLCYIFIARLKIRNIISENDIIITPSPASAMFMSKKRNFILEVHIAYEYFFGNNLMGKLQSRLMRKPSLALFRTKADAKKAKSSLNSSYVYNFFDNSCITEKLLIGDSSRDRKIIFVGRLSYQKNLFKMIECAKLLKEYIEDFTLDIYGTGPLEPLLKQKICDYHLEQNVQLKGFIDDKNIYNHYSVEWLTSDYEGLALTIIEAKACGVPTISTNWGDGVFEAIHNNEDGFIEDSIEGIVSKTIELWEDKDMLVTMSKKAYDNFAEFGKEQALNRWIYILDKVSNGQYILDGEDL